MQHTSLVAIGLALLAQACQDDPRLRAREEAAGRAARAERFDLEDRSLYRQPGGAAEPAMPQPQTRPFALLLDDYAKEVEGILSTPVTPQAISARVHDAIVSDPSLQVRNLEVGMQSGRVVLRGEVRTAVERVQAGDRAREVVGVDRVDNQLRIVGNRHM